MLENILYGLWNGFTGWVVLFAHVFNLLKEYPVYDVGRNAGWYQLGFLIGGASPVFGLKIKLW